MTSPVGDPNAPQPGANLMPNPDQVNEFHRYADTDTSPEAGHHTLGIDPNQASPGGHNHDGRNSAPLSENAIPNNDRIIGSDTRAVDETPAQLTTAGVDAFTLKAPEFKNGSAIGLPGAYYGVVTVSPWGDDSGGGIHQIAYGSSGVGDVWKRYGARSGAWGPWHRVSPLSALQHAKVSTLESTSSTAYTNLTTAGPAVTVDVGPVKKVKLTLTGRGYSSVNGEVAIMGCNITGANTITDTSRDAEALFLRSPAAGGSTSQSITRVVTLANTGSTTFTARYRVNAGTGSFSDREIIAEPF